MMPRRFQVVIVGLVFFVGVLVGVWGAVVTSDSASSASVAQVRKVLEQQRAQIVQLNDAETHRQVAAKQNALALAVVVEGIAGGFSTPPAPDPGRAAAVASLCDTARAFRVSVGDMNPPPCPQAKSAP